MQPSRTTSSTEPKNGHRSISGDKLFVDATWIAEQLGCSLSGAYLLARDIGIVRLGSKRRLVRVLRSDFDAYIEQRREVVTRA